MSFSINNKLSFIDSFKFLSSALDSLVKNLRKDDNNVLDLVKQRGVMSDLYEYMSDFEKFKE